MLIKGGHDEGPRASTCWSSRTRPRGFSAERIATRNTHGTGCTLSAAIAAGLANGLNLTDAVRGAKSYVTAAIAAADRLSIGRATVRSIIFIANGEDQRNSGASNHAPHAKKACSGGATGAVAVAAPSVARAQTSAGAW